MRKYLFSLLPVACALVIAAPTRSDSAQPNIVVILADDLGYGDVGFNGAEDIPTPNIDSIAANGALCTNGYSTHPYCSPSRAALITGRYQHRFGYDTSEPSPGSDNPRQGLSLTELTLPQILKSAGYVSGAIGKWHLGYVPNLHPLPRGFDEFFGFLGPTSRYYNAHLLRGETQLVERSYLTDAFTREGVDFINRHATQPFFLYLAYNAVHTPYDRPPDVYMQRVSNIHDPDRQLYAAMVVALDDGVGQVLQTLQANNILDNTLIFFLSDNGAPSKAATDGGRSNNYPLRGYKLNLLEGGVRVPFAVQWNDRLPDHVVYDDLVSSLDIAAVAAAAAGVTLPADRTFDGLDIVPFLAGEQTSPPRTLFWRWFGLGPDGPPQPRNTIWAVRNGPLKLVVERAKDNRPPALYNLDKDIGELQDLAATQPEDVDFLKQLYDQWTLTTTTPAWQKNHDLQILPLVLAGDWNSFNINDSNSPWNLTRVTAPDLQGTPDAYNWFTNTIHVATTGGDIKPGVHSFALVGAGTYDKQWGGVPVNIDRTTDIPYFSGHSLGPTNSISFEDGFYYSFRIIDLLNQIGVEMRLNVMKTSAPPISVSRSGQTPVRPTPTDPITVSIATSQAKSPEERIFVRWSNDLFITSHIVEATGSGVSYSATIPPQPAGASILYTIVTSTTDLTSYSTSWAIDPLILATTGVFNALPIEPLTLLSAASRITHGTAGPFDVTMPLIGLSGVESRSAATYNAVFTFSGLVTSGQVSVVSGAATIGSTTFDASSNALTAQLTGVTSNEIVVLRVENINGDGIQHGDISFGFLTGDADGDRSVGKFDQTVVQGQLNQAVTSANFRDDINGDGLITNTDLQIVKANKGHVLP
jgi:arylsulfatase A-like enzyme